MQLVLGFLLLFFATIGAATVYLAVIASWRTGRLRDLRERRRSRLMMRPMPWRRRLRLSLGVHLLRPHLDAIYDRYRDIDSPTAAARCNTIKMVFHWRSAR